MKTDQQLQTIHERLLIVMKEFHKVCAENGLHYSLAGGSLIGAMRHKGFIPWDDDMDVMMPYSDFKKLVALAKNFKHEWLEIKALGVTDNHYSYIAQAQDARTTIIEDKNGMPIGVYIDIFPYVKIGNSRKAALLQFYLFKMLHLPILHKNNVYSNCKIYKELLWIIVGQILPKKWLSRMIDKLFDRLDAQPYTYASDPTGNTHGIMPRCVFDGLRLSEFEGEQFYILEQADTYLRNDYGDYMKLPPKEKQVPEHLAYIDTEHSYKTYPYKNRNIWQKFNDMLRERRHKKQ